jgi:UTP--glucose-1-phosphate uridylyltransferase
VTADFAPFERKMRDHGLPDVAIRSFRFAYEQLAAGETGTLSRREIAPPEVEARADDLGEASAAGYEAMARTVVVKLNGGLGTSMGMTRAKSLLPLKGDLTFLDVIARQLVHLRERHGTAVPLVLMNSFRTREDSLRHLAPYGRLSGPLPPDFLQHKVPRIRVEDLRPVEWPADPEQEWCPPGHGDIYAALLSSGMLDAMLEEGYRTAFVSNSDNLGAVLDPAILGFFVESGAPFAMEVKERTAVDSKGGHLARLADGRLVLREIAQCPSDERRDYEDVGVWRYFNTNNLWVDLAALKRTLDERDGVLGLPMIRNEKTVDARDPSTPRVIQLETAMGAAVSVFPGAAAIRVPNERFAPVKTTSDLLRVRSDAYVLSEDARLLPASPDAARIAIDLDTAFFRTIDQLDLRFPKGAPSLVSCRSLRVRGDVRFGAEVVVRGDVAIEAREGSHLVPDGTVLEG